MATMMEHSLAGGTLAGPTPVACLHSVEDSRRHVPGSLRAAGRHVHTLRRRRVDLARRRLAAGRYDSEELLDAVLDMVIEDLTQ